MRPTFHNNQERNPSWRTKERWLHLDCNPNTGGLSVAGFARKEHGMPIDFAKEMYVQGLIALTTARVEDGGFHCVPRSHKFSRAWACKNARHSTSETMNVPLDDPLQSHVQKIPLRAGSLLVWNSLLSHGNFPNYSDKARMVQYIRFVPANSALFAPLAATRDRYPAFWQVSALGKKVFGMEEYAREFRPYLVLFAGAALLACRWYRNK
jgi:hypothetical protein